MTRFFVMTLMFAGILAAVSSSPSSSGSGLLLVANKGDQTLGLIDPDKGRQVATIAEEALLGMKLSLPPMASSFQSMGTLVSVYPARTEARWLWSNSATAR
jgi:hypothetical protein